MRYSNIYKWTHAAKGLTKRALWQLLKDHDGFTRVKVLSGPSQGAQLIVDIRTEASYWLGLYDRKILSAIVRLLKPGQTAYDCGAFLGYYAVAMRKVVGESGKVLLFEGSRNNYSRAAKVPEINSWKNVDVHHLAIGEAHTRIGFIGNQGAASGPASKWGDKTKHLVKSVETVECSGIDELVYERGFAPPNFLKLDLETAEKYALLNGSRVWREHKPIVLVELHKGDEERPPAFEAAEEFLRRFSYYGIEIHLGRPVKTVSDFIGAERDGVQCTILAMPEGKVA
jgi:FkbM family methyltransferase